MRPTPQKQRETNVGHLKKEEGGFLALPHHQSPQPLFNKNLNRRSGACGRHDPVAAPTKGVDQVTALAKGVADNMNCRRTPAFFAKAATDSRRVSSPLFRLVALDHHFTQRLFRI